MSSNPEVIAIIPARGGSKGIHRKNIADLAGKPLVAYTILAASHASYVDRVVVSTEDEEIADISRSFGADVPFLRPRELAEDASGIGEAVSYTISRLGGTSEKRSYVQLYPTSPFRTPTFIDQMLQILHKGYDSVSTVKAVSLDPHCTYIKNAPDGDLTCIFKENGGIPKWKKYYRSYSVLFAHSMPRYEKHYYHVLTDKCMLIDIDTPRDLCWAEAVIRNGLFDFGF